MSSRVSGVILPSRDGHSINAMPVVVMKLRELQFVGAIQYEITSTYSLSRHYPYQVVLDLSPLPIIDTSPCDEFCNNVSKELHHV